MVDYNLIYMLTSRPPYENPEEVEYIRQARNAVLYGGKVNSLVSWTLSDEWTRPAWLNKP